MNTDTTAPDGDKPCARRERSKVQAIRLRDGDDARLHNSVSAVRRIYSREVSRSDVARAGVFLIELSLRDALREGTTPQHVLDALASATAGTTSDVTRVRTKRRAPPGSDIMRRAEDPTLFDPGLRRLLPGGME